ncbi:MAG: GTP cyclohydrolase I FolE [Candidatus Sumerlaeota bacterium]|nr:GTP cyclohydrolase I FolE [Candidatus Sumerlaeota bacterium]
MRGLTGMKELIRKMIVRMGEDPKRQGLKKTPERVAEMFAFLTSGYRTSLEEIINGAIYREDYDEMVCVANIQFYSLCEHHLIPFFGKAHVAYIPDGRLIGLSKIPRIVDMYARRLQLQERLTQQIAQSLADILKPKGVGVVLEAEHLCIQMRGVQKQKSMAVTSAMRGVFKDNLRVRNEFLSLIQHQPD